MGVRARPEARARLFKDPSRTSPAAEAAQQRQDHRRLDKKAGSKATSMVCDCFIPFRYMVVNREPPMMKLFLYPKRHETFNKNASASIVLHLNFDQHYWIGLGRSLSRKFKVFRTHDVLRLFDKLRRISLPPSHQHEGG